MILNENVLIKMVRIGASLADSTGMDGMPTSDDELFTDRDFVKDLPIGVGTKVLDFGSGLGRDAAWLRENRGADVTEVQYADISKPLEFEDKAFEVAYANTVLPVFTSEHSLVVLDELRRVADKVFVVDIEATYTLKRIQVQ